MAFSFLRRTPAPSRVSAGGAGWRLLVQLAVLSAIAASVLGPVLSWRLTADFKRSAIQEEADNTTQNILPLVSRQLSAADLEAPMTGQRYAEFQRFLEDTVLSERTLRVKLWGRDGTVIYSGQPDEPGARYPIEDDLREALAGETAAELGTEDSPDLAARGHVLEVYTPLVLPGSDQVVGAFEIYQDSSSLADRIALMRKYILGGLGIGLGVYYVLLLVLVARAVGTIRRQQQEIEALARDTVRAVVAALDLRDTETEHHGTRVAEISVAIGRRLKLKSAELAELQIGALLHDVGKIGVPDRILRKPEPLTDHEWTFMRRHPHLGYQMLSKFPSLQAAAVLVRAHHERFGGTGYPRGLAGDEIPLPARIFAVADTYDAITSDRPYRAARSHEAALAEIRRCAGSQFDPDVVRAFLEIADGLPSRAGEAEQAQLVEQAAEDISSPRAA